MTGAAPQVAAQAMAPTAARQGHRFGQMGQLLQPIVAISLEAPRVAIASFGLHYFPYRTEEVRRDFSAFGLRRIHFCETARDQAAAVAVTHHVMSAVIPHLAIVRGL